ncbi:AraC family transcriptional regulator [Streptomyces sp. RB6PN25]|uniref:AraC family transcriptional regulator n=1 Tax=Streptomyces humicola TaxID=2953240 RepID=A0ABT1PN80_9ACTN|nr:AraC family transcriptional regulator [Streptomyces humicola]MCQ4079134.1 AraC family transcriptional regulator [Streptomyces humicola]
MREEPLTEYEQFRTSDLDLIREVSGRVLVPHRVEALGRMSSNARLNAASLGSITLAYLRYESDMRLEAPTTEARYFFTVPLTGKAEGVRGKGEVASSARCSGLAYQADDRGVITLSPDYTMFFLRIERPALERQLEGLLGRDVVAPLRFEFAMDLSQPPLRRWVNSVGLLRSELELGPEVDQAPLLRNRIEELVIMGLLLGQPHNYAELLHNSHHPARPRTVKRAIDVIEQQPERPWSLADLARVTGVSGRTLQEGFQRYVDMTPTAYLRDVRLQRVHADLTQAASHTCVSETAYRWGFSHLGRFASAYRRKFGESPSETLRRSV